MQWVTYQGDSEPIGVLAGGCDLRDVAERDTS